MPLYEVEISPGVYEDVEAANPDDARKIVKAQIAKGVLSPVYDDIFFDYDTGVDDLQLRRLLSRAERYDEKESILRNFVGKSGYTRTTDGQLALTPKGLRDRGQPVQQKTLNDGTVVEINTVIDSSSPFERGDFADFMGMAGPVIGSVAGVLPQSRLYKAARGLTKGSPFWSRVIGSAVGGAGGKLTEETADYIQGFQLQDAGDLTALAAYEAGIGAFGEFLGGGLTLLGRPFLGAKAPTSDLRLSYNAARGYDLFDIKKLDTNLGREASSAEIKKAAERGKVKTLSKNYAAALDSLEVNLAGKTQQISEAVLKNARNKSNVPYLTELFDNMTSNIRARGSTLNAYVDDVTGDVVSDTINKTKRNLEISTNETVKATKEAVEDLTNSYIGITPYLETPGIREYGEQILDLLGNAKRKVNEVVGKEYDKVDELFFSVAKYNDLGQPLNAVASAVDTVIKHYQREGGNAITMFLKKRGIDEKSFNSLEPIGDISLRNLQQASITFKNLNKPLPRFEIYGEAGKEKFGKLSRVLEAKRSINSYIQQSSDTAERDLFYKLTRMLDDTDLHKLKGEDYLKQHPQDADSIFTTLGLNGRELIKLENARGKNIFQTVSFDEISKVNESIDLLRAADELNANLNIPFQNAVIKRMQEAARGNGFFDPDEVFSTLIQTGSLRQLDDFFKAVDNYDQYLIGKNQADMATNLNRVKTQTAQRLFANAFEDSIDPVTDTIDFTAFAKYIQKFESKHPGKIDSLFRNTSGAASGETIKQTINQLIKISPRLKAADIEDLISVFKGQDGLDTTAKGKAFILKLKEQAEASAKEADFLANRNLSELPNKSPSEIVETIFRPKNSENIIRLRKIMGEEEFAKVKDASLGKLLEDAIDFRTKGNAPITDIFKVNNLKTALDKYSPETLEAMFGKEFVQDINSFADIINALTKGEVGRGNGPGALIAAGIGAGIVFYPLQAIPTIVGLGITKALLGNPRFVRLLSKTDKGSIRQLFDGLRTTAAQFGYRLVNNELIKADESISEFMHKNVPDLPDINIGEFIGENQQITPPQVNISLPQVSPVQVADPLGQTQQERIEFAERLFRRPII